MLDHSAERSFRKGMELVSSGGYRDALSFFSGAIEIERKAKDGRSVEPRYLSYHGLCLGLARANRRAALGQCRAATKSEPYNADFWENLGRVALVSGKRDEAYRAFQRGLAVMPDHPGIRRFLGRMGVRRPPVLTFLARNNPVNVMLGRARGRLGPQPRNGHGTRRLTATETVRLRA